MRVNDMPYRYVKSNVKNNSFIFIVCLMVVIVIALYFTDRVFLSPGVVATTSPSVCRNTATRGGPVCSGLCSRMGETCVVLQGPTAPYCGCKGGCGNGVVGPGEQCDDGNADACDGCNPNCRSEVCGNGIVECNGEQCDDGNVVDGDGCSAACRDEFCGDGIVQVGLGEDCDLGSMCNDGRDCTVIQDCPPGAGPCSPRVDFYCVTCKEKGCCEYADAQNMPACIDFIDLLTCSITVRAGGQVWFPKGFECESVDGIPRCVLTRLS